MKIGMGNRSTRRKPAPVPRCPPQIPHDHTRAGTRASAVVSRLLKGKVIPVQAVEALRVAGGWGSHIFWLSVLISNSHSGGWSPNWVHSARRPLLAYCTCPGWLCGFRIWWNENWQGKPKYSAETCPSAILSTTNPTWPDPGANPGRCSGKPATSRLSCGTADLHLTSPYRLQLSHETIFPGPLLFSPNFKVFGTS
jgi:hypothetical protein